MKFGAQFLESHASHPIIPMHWREQMTLCLCTPARSQLHHTGKQWRSAQQWQVTPGLPMAELFWTHIEILPVCLGLSAAIIPGTSCTPPGTGVHRAVRAQDFTPFLGREGGWGQQGGRSTNTPAGLRAAIRPGRAWICIWCLATKATTSQYRP